MLNIAASAFISSDDAIPPLGSCCRRDPCGIRIGAPCLQQLQIRAVGIGLSHAPPASCNLMRLKLAHVNVVHHVVVIGGRPRPNCVGYHRDCAICLWIHDHGIDAKHASPTATLGMRGIRLRGHFSLFTDLVCLAKAISHAGHRLLKHPSLIPVSRAFHIVCAHTAACIDTTSSETMTSSAIDGLTATPKKSLIINAFVESCSGHQSPGLWQHPEDKSTSFNNISHWVELAKLLERGKFHGMFIADVLVSRLPSVRRS